MAPRLTRFKDKSFKMLESELKNCGVVGMSFEGLPSDIMIDIFLKLPVKSLGRAMWACKRWHAIITDPDFVENRWKDSVKDHPGYLYIFEGETNIYSMESNRYISTIGGDNVKGELDYCAESICIPYGSIGKTLGKKDVKARTSGGLMAFIIISEKCFCVCNPIIREKIKVPMGPFYRGENRPKSCILWWGLGYSPTSKVYKIIVFHNKFEKDVPDGSIYTLGPGSSWRALPGRFLLPWHSDTDVECDGNLFFFHCMRTDDKLIVASFDVELENFRIWKGPNAGAYNNEHHICSLLTYGDTVAYSKRRRRGSKLFLWVLRNKVNQVWVNELNITTDTVRNFPFVSLYQWINGGTLFGSDKCDNHIIYDAKRGQFNNISLPYSKRLDGSRRKLYRIYPHISTLVSPRQIMGIAVPNI